MVLKTVLGVALVAITIVAVATPEVSVGMLITIAAIVLAAMLVVMAFDRAILYHLSIQKKDDAIDGTEGKAKTK